MNIDALAIYGFNLSGLLLLDDLNIRGFAERNPKITAGDYFNILSKFLALAPDVYDAIKRFGINDSDARDWKNIDAVLALLKEMGCDKYVFELQLISEARSKADYRGAAYSAKNISPEFTSLSPRIIAAKITKDEDRFKDMNVTLMACIKALDAEEAGPAINRELLVLAVDDSTAILEAVSSVLSEYYKVFKLPKPTMLEDVLKQVNPDLFLLDYQMPELSGFELIPIIREYKEYKETPIIFLTSEGTMDNLTAALALGACDFIVKPFNPDQLKEKVSKHIGHRQ